MSGQGEGLDRAVAERLFGSLQREWASHRVDDPREEARDALIALIERCLPFQLQAFVSWRCQS